MTDRRHRRAWLASLALAILSLCAITAKCQDRDALKHIVQDQCVPHWTDQRSPAPCAEVELPAANSIEGGYAVLPDRKGGAHFLLIPTQTISGIESPALQLADTPNYFAAAWRARRFLATVKGREPPRKAVGLALNPPHARSQDQFHIHIECVRGDLIRLLNDSRGNFSGNWSALTIGPWSYAARRIRGEELDEDPIRALSAKLPDAGATIGDYTVVLVGMEYADGPGFVELVSRVAAGELLLDPSCASIGN